MTTWLLPEYIEDILPIEAQRIEHLRRSLLDTFVLHGYELVQPPILEYIDSLLTGTGRDMDLRIFKLVDQLNGRMMGLRADITPQVARIDAHLLNQNAVTRLCYCGNILHTLPADITATREPLQIGAEIYGHGGIESDKEIQQLVVKSLQIAGIVNPQIDMGHVAVFRTLSQRAGIGSELESDLFAALQAKDIAVLRGMTSQMDKVIGKALLLLPELYGDIEILKKAEQLLPDFPEIKKAILDLRNLADACSIPVTFDLADLRGYHYHTGVVFAVYAPSVPNAIVLGGRYDEVGKAFGHARPATGFSMDLREIAKLAQLAFKRNAIIAPYKNDPSLQMKMDDLRSQGHVVIQQLPGQEQTSISFEYNKKLILRSGKWEVVDISVLSPEF